MMATSSVSFFGAAGKSSALLSLSSAPPFLFSNGEADYPDPEGGIPAVFMSRVLSPPRWEKQEFQELFLSPDPAEFQPLSPGLCRLGVGPGQIFEFSL